MLGYFLSSDETKKSSMENIMWFILDEVIMSDINMPDGQMYSFLQLFSNIEKIRLK